MDLSSYQKHPFARTQRVFVRGTENIVGIMELFRDG